MRVYLVHHGVAVDPAVDPGRPLSPEGRAGVDALAAQAAGRGIRPAVVWHSGKLRAKQTAESYWRACNALASFSASRDLQPGDSPIWMRDRLKGETEDILIAGHYPHLPRLLSLMLTGRDDGSVGFPVNGIVALETRDGGETWVETWRAPDTNVRP
jgi:phosphohistidine phosphatase